MLGFGCPELGEHPIDFVTTAPAPLPATRRSDVPVLPRIPAARIVGFASFSPVMVIMFNSLSFQYLMIVSMNLFNEFVYGMIHHVERS